MSYNIRYANPDDGENVWPQRRDRVAQILRRHRVAVAGLQEALREQIDDLSGRLPGYAWTGVGRLDGKDEGEFVPIFYDARAVQFLSGDTFWLSETPEVPGVKGWDARYVRIVTWTKFHTIQNGEPFFCFNTHFDNIGELARRESAHLLLTRMTDIAGHTPAVVMGDFNSTDRTATYRILTGGAPVIRQPVQTPLDDALALTERPHFGPRETLTSGFGDPLISRVDYVFVRNPLRRRPFTQIRVLRHGTLANQVDGRYPSDHLPVLADLELERVRKSSQ